MLRSWRNPSHFRSWLSLSLPLFISSNNRFDSHSDSWFWPIIGEEPEPELLVLRSCEIVRHFRTRAFGLHRFSFKNLRVFFLNFFFFVNRIVDLGSFRLLRILVFSFFIFWCSGSLRMKLLGLWIWGGQSVILEKY